MFFAFHKKSLYFLIIFALFLASVCIYSAAKTEFVSVPRRDVTVVVDAGHGGVDGGSVGKFTGVIESNLNLIYAKNLREKLTAYGFRVVMTRSDGNGLYDPLAKNLKKSDMKKRKEIIESSNADLVLSVHMNSYPRESSHGSQVFFAKGNESGEKLACSVQQELKSLLNNTNKTAKVGDFFIVNCTSLPACLIECGFLSNREEESLLQTKDYQDKFCYAVTCGVIAFFGVSF